MDATPLTYSSERIEVTGIVRGGVGFRPFVEVHPGVVAARTRLGAQRVVDLPIGEQLPRIC